MLTNPSYPCRMPFCDDCGETSRSARSGDLTFYLCGDDVVLRLYADAAHDDPLGRTDERNLLALVGDDEIEGLYRVREAHRIDRHDQELRAPGAIGIHLVGPAPGLAQHENTAQVESSHRNGVSFAVEADVSDAGNGPKDGRIDA